MRYYTKDWYALMQRQHYTSGLHRIPDKHYTDKEIKMFYNQKLQEEIERDRKIYNTPPVMPACEKWLQPDTFDPADTIECFQMCYRMGVRHAVSGYPEWVAETVDKRLLALMMMPESAFQRLKKEEQKNRRTFEKINKAVDVVLSRQEIPEKIQEQFHFHDAHVLALKKARRDVELYLRKDGYWSGDMTPYIKIVFKNVSGLDREKGLVFRKRIEEDGEIFSNCQYLYDELYRTEDGYEVHMLLWTMKALRYLTIRCREIEFEDNLKR